MGGKSLRDHPITWVGHYYHRRWGKATFGLRPGHESEPFAETVSPHVPSKA